MSDYEKHDDRYGVDPFTIAVAEWIAKQSGQELGKLRNFGEEPTFGNNKSDFIGEARYFTEAFTSPSIRRPNPVQLAEIWESVKDQYDKYFTR